MKKTLGSVILCVLMMGFTQADAGILKTSPFGILLGIPQAGYEFKLNEKSSVQINALYFGYTLNSLKYSLLGLSGEYRMYMGQNTFPKGFYWGPTAGVSTGSLEINGQSGNYAGSFFGVMIGHQWLFSNTSEGMSMDLGIQAAIAPNTTVTIGGTKALHQRRGISNKI